MSRYFYSHPKPVIKRKYPYTITEIREAMKNCDNLEDLLKLAYTIETVLTDFTLREINFLGHLFYLRRIMIKKQF